MKLATIINVILGQIGFILLVSDSFPGRQGPVTFFFFLSAVPSVIVPKYYSTSQQATETHFAAFWSFGRLPF